MKQAPIPDLEYHALRQAGRGGWLDAMCFVQNKARRMGVHAIGAIRGCS